MRDLLKRLEEAQGTYYTVTVTGGNVRYEDPETGRMAVLGRDETDTRKLSFVATKRARADFEADDQLLAGYGDKRLPAGVVQRIDAPNISVGRDGKVTTVFEVEATRPLTAAEQEAMADYVMGQCSDGWGEGFEQDEFEIDDERLYVSTWSRHASAKVTAR